MAAQSYWHWYDHGEGSEESKQRARESMRKAQEESPVVFAIPKRPGLPDSGEVKAGRPISMAEARQLATDILRTAERERLKYADDVSEAIGDPSAEVAALRQAMGLLTTIKGDMPVNVHDPISMAQDVVAYTAALRAEVERLRDRLEVNPDAPQWDGIASAKLAAVQRTVERMTEVVAAAERCLPILDDIAGLKPAPYQRLDLMVAAKAYADFIRKALTAYRATTGKEGA